MALNLIDFDRYIPYHEALLIQKRLVELKLGGIKDDFLVLLEHYPVITVGRNGRREHLLVPQRLLRRESIALHHADRGGDIAYHGPGQLVGYPILDLNNFRSDPLWYVRSLEVVIIRTLSYFGVTGTKERGFTGVWVGKEKIAAIGVSIKKTITAHGFALNICPLLAHFSYIVPCGLRDRGVTSMLSLLNGSCPTVEEVKPILLHNFFEVFETVPAENALCCSSSAVS